MSPEELSFRNLVEFYRDELIQIVNGAHASEVFTENRQKSLVRYGVIHRVPEINRTLPTPEARKLLDEGRTEEEARV